MGLTGIQILKKLPKKNCGECGVPTCMAFAMKVAAGQADIGACPYVDPAVKEEIAEASAPPVRVVKLGGGEHTYKLGGDTVLFRHEKRFESPTLIGTLITTEMDASEVEKRLNYYKKYQWDRVGIKLQPDVILIQGKGDAFEGLVKKVREEIPWVAIILKSEDLNSLSKGIEVCGDFKPAIFSEEFSGDLINLAKEKKVPLIIKGNTIGDVAKKSEEAIKQGLKEIILDTGARSVREVFEDQVILRKAAIKKRFKPLGFPTIVFTYRYADSLVMEGIIASLLIPKYAGIIIMSDLRPDILLNLLIEKMNIFTDPQKPLTVEEGIYPVNGPDEYSPVIITCNFALTYFIVNGEVEGSRVPTWLLIKDTDGLSVLTAWAAGKFNADNIAEFVKKCGIADKVKHRKLAIPGYVGGMKGELEEELPDWEILVGPREASGLPAFLKKLAKELREEAGVPAGTVSGGEEVKEEAKPKEEAPSEGAPEGQRVICIAESINIMSKRIGPAMKERNPEPIQKMAKEETELGADYLDLNIGPAKKDGPELASWIVKVVEEVVDTPISLDTTNPDAMTAGLKVSKNPQKALMNSITIQKSRLEKLGPLAAELGCNVVALLWGESGLPRDANERAALVVDLVGKLNEYGIPNEKIWVDPILTPITLGADQIQETLTFLSMLQEITPGVKTTIGLSNVSNGVATHLRPYLNRVMLMMLMKYGLYSAILDVYDKELVEIAKGKHPDWVEMVHKMMDGEEPDVKSLSPKELEIYKTVKVLTGETIFSESWLEV